jgi:hypothetical protein
MLKRSSRPLMAVVGGIVFLTTAGYWWMNRPKVGRLKPDNSGLYRINVNGKYGFMDRSGKTVIAPQFDQAFGFSEAMAPVRIGAKWGFIDTKGTVAVTPQFDQASGFSEGLAAVQVGTKFGFINKKGVVAITPQFDDAAQFYNGRVAVKLCCGRNWDGLDAKTGHSGANRYGFIDKNGKYLGMPGLLFAEPQYSSNRLQSEDATLVRTGDDHVGIMNSSGKVVIIDKGDELGWASFTDGLAPVASDGKWGYVNAKGKWSIEPQFEHAYGFEDGLATVTVGGRSGLIGIDGKFVVNPQYDFIFGVSEGYAIFESGKGSIPGCQYCGNYGFIDTKGRIVVDAKFVQHPDANGGLRSPAAPFSEGLAAVKTDAGWGFIDTTGKMVIDPQFDDAGSFTDGLAFVTALGKDAYITRTGAFVIDPFPGTNLAAERTRLESEAAQARKKIEGEWMGTFANTDNIIRHLNINSNGGVVVTIPIGYGPGGSVWREIFRGQLDSGNQKPPAGVVLVGAFANTSARYRTVLNFNENNGSLTGNLVAANGATVGRIELTRPPL